MNFNINFHGNNTQTYTFCKWSVIIIINNWILNGFLLNIHELNYNWQHIINTSWRLNKFTKTVKMFFLYKTTVVMIKIFPDCILSIPKSQPKLFMLELSISWNKSWGVNINSKYCFPTLNIHISVTTVGFVTN